jgi:hypothetical protein
VTTAIGAYATAAALKARAGITDTTDDTLLGTICDQVNQYIESKTHRVLAPISSATYLYDGDGSRCLSLPRPAVGPPIGGIRAVTSLEIAQYTSAAYVTIDASQYFLRSMVGMTGPYEELLFTDYPTGMYAAFPRGLSTVRLTGTAGWAAIPDDITELALVAAIRAWTARQAGQSDIVGTDEFGRPLISRFFSTRDMGTLYAYSTDIPA